ncbi:MAG: DUF2550 domain-containing protein [Streptosporangiaceae bacterium]|nr:DUF2550 domain-containing protein [Streptosporangiaceae bacterium]MBV9855262.1 DUF2550 domain-containing protein [Streptosporangiaceae bacterium]
MGGALALDAAWLFAAFLLIVVLFAVTLAARRFWLERGGGTVECGLRRPAGTGTWRLGVASYQPDDLFWYGALGVLLRPEEIFPRRTLTVVSRRPPGDDEAATLGPNRIVIETRTAPGGGDVELAMTEQALTGFLAWLEAAPPGSHLDGIGLTFPAGAPQDVAVAGAGLAGEDEQQV